jgi:outer membrane protein OmpA-like peptidoglycan-associated protein
MHKSPNQAEPGRQVSGFSCRWLAPALRWVLVLWLPIAGAACSGSGGSEADAGDQDSAIEDEEYPNLARVPGEQPRPTPSSLRDELMDGLAADHANARYTGEPLTAASAAVPPAAPPPAAQPQVEIIWETLRVSAEGDAAAAEEAAGSGAGAAAAGAAAGGSEATTETTTDGSTGGSTGGTQEEIEINWETERVEPSGKVSAAGGSGIEEELILAPGPELVGVVYFAHDSAQVGTGDRDLLEAVVALYKERGGRLRLVGHSSAQASTEDEVAQRMVNLDLSLKRANAVATTLLDLGAEKEKLMIEAKADSEPASVSASVPASDEVIVGGESGDRRVEIFLEH